MVVDDVDAWSPKLRSRSQLVETPSVTSSNCYRRKDDVYVVPLGCLGP
jgi:hypothetical protein